MEDVCKFMEKSLPDHNNLSLRAYSLIAELFINCAHHSKQGVGESAIDLHERGRKSSLRIKIDEAFLDVSTMNFSDRERAVVLHGRSSLLRMNPGIQGAQSYFETAHTHGDIASNRGYGLPECFKEADEVIVKSRVVNDNLLLNRVRGRINISDFAFRAA